MAFNSQGVYVVVSGAATAIPGQVISSAVWNNIHSDEATALTSLGAYTFYANARTITVSTAFTVGPTDQALFLNRGTAGLSSTTITMPAATARLGNPVFVKDIAGNALANNIVLLPVGGDLIEGASSYILGTNYGLASVVALAGGGWVITGPDSANGVLTAGPLLTTSSTAGVGYFTGSGTSQTQILSKSQSMTINRPTAQITMNNATLAANTVVSFAVTNSVMSNTDLAVLNHVSGGTAGAYLLNAQPSPTGGTLTINVRNVTAGSLAEAIVIGFAIIKSVIT